VKTVFFGYPARPDLLRETLNNAALAIDRDIPDVRCQTWESLKIGGKLVISPILAAIDAAEVAIFEVTQLNENVMFELGYAIGSRTKIWLLRDPSEKAAERDWKKMSTLATVGFAPYANSEHIRVAYRKERPDEQKTSIFDEEIAPVLEPLSTPALFYIQNLHDNEAARALTRRVYDEEKQGLRVITADPRESAVMPLAWYGQQIYASSAVIAHFEAPTKSGAEIHNARCALIAGLARGMGRPLLMLAQLQYLAPIDYKDLLYIYGTAEYAVSYSDTWLTKNLASAYAEIKTGTLRASRLQLSTELKSLRFGDHVAENEADVLVEYFLETPAFDDVVAKRRQCSLGAKALENRQTFFRPLRGYARTNGI